MQTRPATLTRTYSLAHSQAIAAVMRAPTSNHGRYTEPVSEKDLVRQLGEAKAVVVHFYKADFRRCQIVDKHLEVSLMLHVVSVAWSVWSRWSEALAAVMSGAARRIAGCCLRDELQPALPRPAKVEPKSKTVNRNSPGACKGPLAMLLARSLPRRGLPCPTLITH